MTLFPFSAPLRAHSEEISMGGMRKPCRERGQVMGKRGVRMPGSGHRAARSERDASGGVRTSSSRSSRSIYLSSSASCSPRCS